MPENQAELFEEQVKLFGQHKWWKGDLNCSLPIATHLILNYILQHWIIYIYFRQIIKPYLDDQNDLSMHTLPMIHFCLYFLLIRYTLFCTQLVRFLEKANYPWYNSCSFLYLPDKVWGLRIRHSLSSLFWGNSKVRLVYKFPSSRDTC